jgi:1-acyl-sn-glycerol-3-phosphate acyltransferase
VRQHNIKWQVIGNQVPPGGNAVTRWLGRTILRSLGWRIQGTLPNAPKFIIAVAPHSSNFDFILTVCVIMSLGFKCNYLAKASLFRFPLGIIVRAFGGIPVDRSTPSGLVDQMAALFASAPKMILGIAPEGTRKKVHTWRSGFALIAKAADVPIQPAVIHYRQKLITFTTLITDTRDPTQTLERVQQDASTGSIKGA